MKLSRLFTSILGMSLLARGLSAPGASWNPAWPAPPIWSNGPCMNAVYGLFNNNELGCTAKEVYANNDAATAVEGPSECERGDYIYVNVTASLHFNADRYDVGIYTATSACDPSASASCGLEAATCAVDILDSTNQATAPSNVFSNDAKDGQDSCYEVVTGSGGWDLTVYDFQKNMKIPCDDSRAAGETGTTTVHMQSCFSWRTSGNDENCDE